MTKNNNEMQKDIKDIIKWTPLLSAAETGITVKDGVVRSGGAADNYLKKPEAADATKPEHTATYMGKGEWQHQKKKPDEYPGIQIIN